MRNIEWLAYKHSILLFLPWHSLSFGRNADVRFTPKSGHAVQPAATAIHVRAIQDWLGHRALLLTQSGHQPRDFAVLHNTAPPKILKPFLTQFRVASGVLNSERHNSSTARATRQAWRVFTRMFVAHGRKRSLNRKCPPDI